VIVDGQLFDHSLLLAAVVCASTLVRLLRRNDGIGRGYALLVGAQLLLAVLAIGGQKALGTVALCLVAVTVVLPWLLEHGSRWAFARGHLIWVARMSSLRASLMPGSGLARQMPIIEGLALLERKGVDVALGHFRRLADEAEDPAELATIHEQIVSMLFLGQRWDEGIAHYERRFQAGYAAVRPSLALGLLRAYGEAGRLETAAKLLRELEDGPVGADPSRLELLGQARLTFLAYAGAIEPIDEFVARRQFVELGLSPATAELFKGIAHARAGEPRVAVETLSKVESLAGPRDRRVLEAARSVLERVGLAL
jgi:tetratricopeptide (TPR) repeat protein